MGYGSWVCKVEDSGQTVFGHCDCRGKKVVENCVRVGNIDDAVISWTKGSRLRSFGAQGETMLYDLLCNLGYEIPGVQVVRNRHTQAKYKDV